MKYCSPFDSNRQRIFGEFTYLWIDLNHTNGCKDLVKFNL